MRLDMFDVKAKGFHFPSAVSVCVCVCAICVFCSLSVNI